jgi:hypothetical protein
MRTTAIILLAALIAAPLAAQSKTADAPQGKPHGIPNLNQVNVVIDGRASEGEYPTRFVNSQTGIAVSWVSDGEKLYVALESPAKGWVAIGFGSHKVRGTSMFIGYHDQQGGRVDEHEGTWVSTHRPIDRPRLIDFKTAQGPKGTAMEFVIPLELSNGQVIAPGQPMPFVLAYHAKKVSFKGRPTKKATATLLLGKPEKAGAEGKTQSQE